MFLFCVEKKFFSFLFMVVKLIFIIFIFLTKGILFMKCLLTPTGQNDTDRPKSYFFRENLILRYGNLVALHDGIICFLNGIL